MSKDEREAREPNRAPSEHERIRAALGKIFPAPHNEEKARAALVALWDRADVCTFAVYSCLARQARSKVREWRFDVLIRDRKTGQSNGYFGWARFTEGAE